MKNLVVGDKFRIGKSLPMWGVEGFTPGVNGGIYYTAVNIHKGNYETFTHEELDKLGDKLNVFRLEAEVIEKPSSLKNPKSTYYEVYNGLESIDIIELILTND